MTLWAGIAVAGSCPSWLIRQRLLHAALNPVSASHSGSHSASAGFDCFRSANKVTSTVRNRCPFLVALTYFQAFGASFPDHTASLRTLAAR